MVTCCSYGCTNRSNMKKPGVTFHRFPNNHMRIQWINSIRRKNWQPSAHTRICSDHFVESDFDRSFSRVKLKDHAVPSVFKAFPKYMQKKESHHRRTERNIKATSSLAQTLPLQIDEHDSTIISDNLTINTPELIPSSEDPPIISESPILSCIFPTNESKSSPPKQHLEWKLKMMSEKLQKMKRKLKTEKQKNKRQKTKIVELSVILRELQKKKFMNEDDFESLSRTSAPFEELLSRLLAKKDSFKSLHNYPPKLRKFALNLHYYSPRAYNYVRKTFNSCLPHPKTISKWYTTINCQPGFTDEALKCLLIKSTEEPKPICSLVLDEIAIRKHPCFDGKICHGYVNFGGEHDDSRLAKEALVFMVVSINKNWKIPVGYFLLDGISSAQKANLVRQCLLLLHEAGTEIISLTFDGLATNISMATHLGCNFSDCERLNSTFLHPSTGKKIAVFLDPCHMLKLIRNCLGEKKVIFDYENKPVEWKFLAYLFQKQSEEGLHLGNKIKASHILFHKQKMKVSLAAQTLSDSVADAIEFCTSKLQIKEFSGSEATVRFIRFFNKLFDLFNSRSMKQLPHKRPVSKENCNEVLDFLKEAVFYLDGLRVKNSNAQSDKILVSNRKTGFLGFKVCIASLLHLILVLLKADLMEFIPLYRISQDHLELFFSSVRFMGGSNNNPTARQFKAAYRKLLLHSELQDCTTGNCIPLEQVSLLSCSSAQRPLEIINLSSDRSRIMNEDDIITHIKDQHDHTYFSSPGHLSEFNRECVEFIAGSIVRRISKTLKCRSCLEALYGERRLDSLTSLKSKGRLIHPSRDVVEVCRRCETIFRMTFINSEVNAHKLNVLKFTSAALNTFIDSNIFNVLLESHMYDMSPIDNHRSYLIKEIAYCFYQARIGHFTKKQIDAPSIRSICTKLPLFKGQ